LTTVAREDVDTLFKQIFLEFLDLKLGFVNETTFGFLFNLKRHRRSDFWRIIVDWLDWDLVWFVDL